MKADVATAEPALESKTAQETTSPRGRKSKRRSVPASSVGASVRFFISKTGSDRLPIVDQELETEAEAMIESLKTGKSYLVISEWKSVPDLSKKVPQIRKECITNKKTNPL
jgi:hypothetical protein